MGLRRPLDDENRTHHHSAFLVPIIFMFIFIFFSAGGERSLVKKK